MVLECRPGPISRELVHRVVKAKISPFCLYLYLDCKKFGELDLKLSVTLKTQRASCNGC